MRSSVIAPASIRGTEDAAPEPLLFSLLGTFAARYAGRAFPLRLPDQALRLLAFLLLHRDRMHPREHVAFSLWPDDDEADARANLRRKLHLIMKALPESREPWILTTNTTVGWNPAAAFELDVADFESRVAAGAGAEADALYRAELLVGFDDDWVLRERERLATLATTNLLALIATAQRRRDYAAAIACAQRLRALDPWREDAVRALISLRYESGDRAGALTEYERFRASINDEMGVEPMAETVCVYESVRDNAAAATQTSALASPVTQTVHALPFVGRVRENAEIAAAWQTASSGTGTARIIVGEAGIGKSRLLEEFATFAQANGGRVLRGGTTPFEVGPYQPFSEALRTALPILRESRIEPLWLAVLATLVPGLHGAFPKLPPVIPLEPEPERTRLFEAVDVALGAISAARPTVLILEDLHWAGSTTIALFEYLTRRAAAHRLLILASYREDDLARTHPLRATRRRLEREKALRIVALGPLDSTAIEEIVRQFIDDAAPQRSAIVQYLHEASDGNPFFLGELVANDRETGVLDAQAHRWRTRENSIESMLSLTSTLQARLERLSTRARSVADIAAVIGRAFSAELVREVSGIDERTTLDSLDELIDRRLVRDIDASGIDFAFSHHLIVQAVYAAMPLDARQLRHRRVGSVMEEIYSDKLEEIAAELAAHFDRGGEPEHAAQYYCVAARHALSMFGTQEAQTLAERGRELTRVPLTRFRCIEVLEEASRRLVERDAQRAHIEALLALSSELAEFALLREALRRKVLLAHDCGEREEERVALAALEDTLPLAPAPWSTMFAQLKGSYLTSIGQYREARAILADAFAGLSDSDYPRIYVEHRCALIRLACFEGRTEDVRQFLDDIPSLEKQHDIGRFITLLETACAAASTIQDHAALTSCATKLLQLARAIGYREGEATAHRFAGKSALGLFQIDQARFLLNSAIEIFSEISQRLNVMLTMSDLAVLAATIGHFDDAIATFEAADAIALNMSYGFGHVACVNNISCAAYLKGDFTLALSAAQRAIEAADAIAAPSARAHALVNMGIAQRELGALEEAIANLENGTSLERDLNERIALSEDLCELCIAYLRRNDCVRAATVGEEVRSLAAQTLRELSRPQFVLWTLAAMSRATGSSSAAQRFLTDARRMLDELEAKIPDSASRLTFRSLPHNRAIDDAFDRDIWTI